MKCGFYEKEITPPIGCDMPGQYMNRYADEVKDRLYVKAVVFCDDSGLAEKCGALVVADAVELSKVQCGSIISRASRYTGIPENSISVAANHTHQGIPVGDVISAEDKAFMDVFCRLAADCVTFAFHRMKNCKASCGVGKAEGVSFVRDYVLTDGNIVTNPGRFRSEIVRPNGMPDTDVPVLSIYDEEGKPYGCLVSFACHQDCVGGLAYTGDFSSELSRRMKAQYGEDFVSIYLAGASGEINHIDFINNRAQNYLETGDILSKEAIRLTESPNFMADYFDNRKEELPLHRRHAGAERIEKARWELEDIENRRGRYDMTGQRASLLLMYEEDFAGKSDEINLPIHVFRVGEATIFSLPGELYSAFGHALREGCPDGKGLVCELSHMRAGYVPTRELFCEEVYPVQLCHGSCLEEEAGYKMVQKALEIAASL
ncbi:MAG: hypothetical protein E7487_01430 [Ruminococcaceae bacterium]|nr:hypothetical protein [Oscillospiraceae bacterium]